VCARRRVVWFADKPVAPVAPAWPNLSDGPRVFPRELGVDVGGIGVASNAYSGARAVARLSAARGVRSARGERTNAEARRTGRRRCAEASMTNESVVWRVVAGLSAMLMVACAAASTEPRGEDRTAGSSGGAASCEPAACGAQPELARECAVGTRSETRCARRQDGACGWTTECVAATTADTPVAPSPSAPVASPGAASPQACRPDETVGDGGRCFASSAAACASLPCARASCVVQETAPAVARCR
jgi:hypothetical protein